MTISPYETGAIKPTTSKNNKLKGITDLRKYSPLQFILLSATVYVTPPVYYLF